MIEYELLSYVVKLLVLISYILFKKKKSFRTDTCGGYSKSTGFLKTTKQWWSRSLLGSCLLLAILTLAPIHYVGTGQIFIRNNLWIEMEIIDEK